jgi:hypothetical protein
VPPITKYLSISSATNHKIPEIGCTEEILRYFVIGGTEETLRYFVIGGRGVFIFVVIGDKYFFLFFMNGNTEDVFRYFVIGGTEEVLRFM